MKSKKYLGLLLSILLLLMCGCTKSYDGPPRPDTPEPGPLTGTYSGDYGTLIFNGDGVTVNAVFSKELSEVIGIPQEAMDYEYAFCWYNFGECRWDVATSLHLSSKEMDKDFDFSINGNVEPVTRETIKLDYYMTDGFNGMIFELQKVTDDT